MAQFSHAEANGQSGECQVSQLAGFQGTKWAHEERGPRKWSLAAPLPRIHRKMLGIVADWGAPREPCAIPIPSQRRV